jgi:hypothetical protein
LFPGAWAVFATGHPGEVRGLRVARSNCEVEKAGLAKDKRGSADVFEGDPLMHDAGAGVNHMGLHDLEAIALKGDVQLALSLGQFRHR